MLTYVSVLCQIRTSTTKFFQKLHLMMELKKWVMKGGSEDFCETVVDRLIGYVTTNGVYVQIFKTTATIKTNNRIVLIG